MSSPLEPGGNGGPDKPKLTTTRIAIWLIVGGVAVYLIISGIVGILAKG
ncbi:MAG: hypothetical protein ABIS08_00855 [Pseudolysinimonas sp.]